MMRSTSFERLVTCRPERPRARSSGRRSSHFGVQLAKRIVPQIKRDGAGHDAPPSIRNILDYTARVRKGKGLAAFRWKSSPLGARANACIPGGLASNLRWPRPAAIFFRICEDFARLRWSGRAGKCQNPWWTLAAERNRLAYPEKLQPSMERGPVMAKPRAGRLCLPCGVIVLVARDACPQISAWDASAGWRGRAYVQAGPSPQRETALYSAYLSMRLPPQELPHPAAQL